MNSKLILLIGGLLSALIVYVCLKSQYKKTIIKNDTIKVQDIIKQKEQIHITSKINNVISKNTTKITPQANNIFNTNIKSTMKKIEKEEKSNNKAKTIDEAVENLINDENNFESNNLEQKVTKNQNAILNKENNKTINEVKYESYIYYKPNQQISLLLPPLDNHLKAFFENICQDPRCIKEIKYKNNTLYPKWLNIAHDTILFLKDHNISNALLTSKDNRLEINITFDNEQDYKNFQKSILSVIDNSLITSNILVKPKKVNNIKSENNPIVKPKIEEIKPKVEEIKKQINSKQSKVTNSINKKIIQKEINKLLKINPVHFISGSDKLSLKGKKSLRKVIKLLRKYKNIKFTILVRGRIYTGKKLDFYRKLAQKRADSVKWYLKQRVKNISFISAAGFSTYRSKYKKYPKTKIEIIIRKGIVND